DLSRPEPTQHRQGSPTIEYEHGTVPVAHLAHLDPERKAHAVEVLGQRPRMTLVDEQPRALPIIHNADRVLDAPLRIEQQRLNRFARLPPGEGLTRHRVEPGEAILAPNLNDAAVRQADRGVPGIERTLLGER